MDHYYLQSWVWGSLESAKAYKEAEADFTADMKSYFKRSQSLGPDRRAEALKMHRANQEAGWRTELAKYHLLMTLGMTVRILRRSQHLFPAMQPAWSRANHLLSEATMLRNMLEHYDDGYLEGKGRHQDKFVRKTSNMTVDAVSNVFITDKTVIAGRLDVDTVIAELSAIQEVVDEIPAPGSS